MTEKNHATRLTAAKASETERAAAGGKISTENGTEEVNDAKQPTGEGPASDETSLSTTKQHGNEPSSADGGPATFHDNHDPKSPQSGVVLAPLSRGPSQYGFQSPTSSSTTPDSSLRTSEEYLKFEKLISETDPAIVRQAVRDNRQICLFGSDHHMAFIANAMFNQGKPATLLKAIQNFGKPAIRAAKSSVVEHLTTEDLDSVADQVLSKASSDLLDKALAMRLETIKGRALVNALARAERLGYEVNDVVEADESGGSESVIPSLPVQPQAPSFQTFPHGSHSNTHMYPPPFPPPVAPNYITLAHNATQYSRQSKSNSPMPAPASNMQILVHCKYCKRPCSGPAALRQHQAKKACQHTYSQRVIGKELCPHCGSFFGSGGGLPYHLKSKVCGQYSDETREQVEAAVMSLLQNHTSLNGPIYPGQASASPTPPTSRFTTPVQRGSSLATPEPSVVIASSPSASASKSGADPYAVLTPENRQKFEDEMKAAEIHYGGLMKATMKLPTAQREQELGRLKNSYNTKQSTTRKKYGIRLRERRSKAEVEAEREKMLRSPGNVSKTSLPTSHISKKARTGDFNSMSGSSSTPQRLPLTNRSGLSASPGAAEQLNPTGSRAQSQSQRQPAPSVSIMSPDLNQGTSEDPMVVDTSDSDDDEDIPARLPTTKT